MMIKSETSEIAITATEGANESAKKTKVKAKSKAKAPRAKVGKSTKAAHEFDFVGRVEILRVKSGAGAEGLEFGLKGRHGKRKCFRFDATDAFAMNAMAHVVLAAHANDTKIGVRTGPEVEGVLIVRELESRPKFGKGA